MRCALIISLVVLMVVSVAGIAGAADLTLSKYGRVYHVTVQDDQLVLIIGVDSEHEQLRPVPGTTGDQIEQPIVMFDDDSESVVLVWQHNIDNTWAQIMLATYREGTWIGPVPMAGMNGIRASNPEALLHEVTCEGKDGITFGKTYLYLAWWSDEFGESGGHAVSATVPLVKGMPLLAQMERQEHREILPFGIACLLSGTEQALKQPKLFFDPASGDPHIAFVELHDCLFSVQHIDVVANEAAIAKRGRQITVWRNQRSYAIHPSISMDLARAKFDVGHDLSIVMYWDEESMIKYAVLKQQPDVRSIKTLHLTDSISHERAVELIRERAHR